MHVIMILRYLSLFDYSANIRCKLGEFIPDVVNEDQRQDIYT